MQNFQGDVNRLRRRRSPYLCGRCRKHKVLQDRDGIRMPHVCDIPLDIPLLRRRKIKKKCRYMCGKCGQPKMMVTLVSQDSLDEREEPKLLDSSVPSDMTTARIQSRSNLNLFVSPQA